jgi:hypothetical protein
MDAPPQCHPPLPRTNHGWRRWPTCSVRAAQLPPIGAPRGQSARLCDHRLGAAADAGLAELACLSRCGSGRIGPVGCAVSPAAGWCMAVDLATVAESAAVAAAACRAAGRRGQGVQVSLLRTSRTGYRVAWDTASHGIPRRMGYRVARDTVSDGTRVAQGSTSSGHRVAWDTMSHGIPCPRGLPCLRASMCRGRGRSACLLRQAPLRLRPLLRVAARTLGRHCSAFHGCQRYGSGSRFPCCA